MTATSTALGSTTRQRTTHPTHQATAAQPAGVGVGGVNQPPRVVLADPSNRVLLFRFTPPDPWPKEPAWHLPGLMARVHTTSPATLPWTHEN